jgi:aerobic-type carbon monoxide dehydrogenase small subunit (CoxS/CutS family)
MTGDRDEQYERGRERKICTPGIILAAKSLLEKNPFPDKQDVKEALAGHHCRCISHYHVLEAVLEAAKEGG